MAPRWWIEMSPLQRAVLIAIIVVTMSVLLLSPTHWSRVSDVFIPRRK
jgi:hypothetical protein